MSLRARLSMVVVLAAIVLGGFMPQALLTGTYAAPGQMAIARPGPPTFPSGCAGASCSKSAPGVPTPVLTIAALAGMVGVLFKASGGGSSRRIRTLARSLARGVASTLFHPPQFSTHALLAA
jgi:hypothetical protein